MHDWWLAHGGRRLGRLVHLPQATVLYRRHGQNQVGAHGRDASLIREGLRCFERGGFRERMQSTQRQAQAMLDRFGSELTPEQRSVVEAYAGLHEHGFFQRRAT